MAQDLSLEISDDTLKKILIKKNEAGFGDKSWDDWFNFLLGITTGEDSTKVIIEKVFKKSNYDIYYDNWIKNFALNLDHVWNEHSARDLVNLTSQESSAIVIGRGPSLIKNNHLDLLKKSGYEGNIICSDGILMTVLKAGITPDKFEKFFVVTIDSQDHQKKFYEDDIVLQYGNKIKCILATTVSPSTYEAVKKARMERYWLHTLFDYDKGNSSFNYISARMVKSKNHERGLPAIQTGGNVGTSSWVIGWSLLKSTTVCLIGLDMGYPSDVNLEQLNYHKFPEGIDKNSEAFKKAYPVIYNPEFNCECRQDPIFQYYCNALKEFIFKTSDKIRTVNASEGGALFGDGIKCMRFKEFLHQHKT